VLLRNLVRKVERIEGCGVGHAHGEWLRWRVSMAREIGVLVAEDRAPSTSGGTSDAPGLA
jgi:hypothetical protein